MTIVLGDNQYGKAETHVVRITRRGSTHDIKDLNDGVGEVEEFGVRLARHFVGEFASVYRARVSIEEFAWDRIHDHAFVRSGAEKRLATVTSTDDVTWVVGGVADLVILKSTGSEFHGYIKDRYTTLPETRDRVMATSLSARWRFCESQVDWATSFADVRRLLLDTFASKHSLSLQQTLYAMGEAVLEARPEIAEVRLSMPNKHHFAVDLSPFGMENENEVFYAADRPYGLIEGTVTRDDAPEPGFAW